MNKFILAIFITVAVIAAEAYPQGSYGKSAPSTGYPETKSAQEEPQPYEFSWAVKDEPSKNDYAHEEKSDGKVVTGSYRVLLPDGRTQIVTYTADENGYVADVKYEGEAKAEEPAKKSAYPQPSSYPKNSAY